MGENDEFVNKTEPEPTCFALIGADFFLIRMMISVMESTKKPTDNQADRQDQKEHQRPGKGDMPEQEIDIDLFAVLEGKDHNQKEENYGKNHFNIHVNLPYTRFAFLYTPTRQMYFTPIALFVLQYF
jgi:CRISPR/Cas system CSM-associated protein Csm5 (group 7 of RAMP superfamily)